MSPYTLEEVVSRDYLLKEKPEAIINLVDATNIERNLYLTTQLLELGIPVVIALNMADLLEKNKISIDTKALEKELGCKVVKTSALKGTGIREVVKEAVTAAKKESIVSGEIKFSKDTEAAVSEMEGQLPSSVLEEQKRWYAIKLRGARCESTGAVKTDCICTESSRKNRCQNWKKGWMMTQNLLLQMSVMRQSHM